MGPGKPPQTLQCQKLTAALGGYRHSCLAEDNLCRSLPMCQDVRALMHPPRRKIILHASSSPMHITSMKDTVDSKTAPQRLQLQHYMCSPMASANCKKPYQRAFWQLPPLMTDVAGNLHKVASFKFTSAGNGMKAPLRPT